MFIDKQKSKILIVDDVPSNIRILTDAMRNEYKIIFAMNGQQAIEKATSEQQPDLILLDIVLPDIDGYEVCRQLKGNELTKDIPVIFITTKSDETDEAKGFECGGVDYITKPFSIPIVNARVKTHIELKKKRDTLEKMTSHLEHLNQMKNNFIGIAAHDLRNPLGAILSFTKILNEELQNYISDDQQKIFEIICEQSKHMLAFVNDLLDVAVIESGKLDLHISQNNLVEMVQNRICLFQHMSKKKNIQISTDFESIPLIGFDQDRIAQVIDNLLSNAIKFSSQSGKITVKISQIQEKIRVDVTDEGAGIPEKNQPHIFGTFKKFKNNQSGGETSTGLGLSIVKRIIETHNGTIQVKSKKGKGTTMSFFLPQESA